jgi:hypothetical protein
MLVERSRTAAAAAGEASWLGLAPSIAPFPADSRKAYGEDGLS